MLHAVYSIHGQIEVCDDDEKNRLLATKVWFDHPNTAKEALKKLNAYEDGQLVSKKKKGIKNENG